MAALAKKCRQQHGFLDHYSFGVRWEIYRRFHQEPSFHLRATDLLPPPPRLSLDDQMLRTIFCLCPSGTGWGMRVFHSAALGCIPVIIQRDEKSLYPPVGAPPASQDALPRCAPLLISPPEAPKMRSPPHLPSGGSSS